MYVGMRDVIVECFRQPLLVILRNCDVPTANVRRSLPNRMECTALRRRPIKQLHFYKTIHLISQQKWFPFRTRQTFFVDVHVIKIYSIKMCIAMLKTIIKDGKRCSILVYKFVSRLSSVPHIFTISW